jgi:hypothetical protein
MVTDLFAVVSGLQADAVALSIPPAVRRPLVPPAGVRVLGNDVIVDFPVFRPRRPVTQVVPSFSALTPADYSFRFEAAPGSADAESWVGATSIGAAPFEALPVMSEALRSEIDVFVAGTPLESVRLRLHLRATNPQAVMASPWLVALSACDGGPIADSGLRAEGSVALAIPPLSQMEEAPDLRQRICSPTCLAMILRHRGRDATVAELAAEMFHPALDLYGVWPCAIQAAARRGILGYLLRFPDWESAAWCLTRDLPIVASVRYSAGELTGAAIAGTLGHLLVLTGFEDGEVLVNDPAAPSRAGVARRYRLDEMRRIWLERTGVGYVFCAPQ